MENRLSLINGADPKNRLDHLVANIPTIFKHKTLLYVGAGNRLQLFDEFVKNGYEIDIVEVYQPNILKLQDVSGIRSIFCADIMRFAPNEKYDVVLFWHGIEHLDYYQVPKLLVRLKKMARKLIVFGMPYGKYEQGAVYDNPYEVHKTHWYPDDLKGFKMNVSTIGKKDTKRANMIAWLGKEGGVWI